VIAETASEGTGPFEGCEKTFAIACAAVVCSNLSGGGDGELTVTDDVFFEPPHPADVAPNTATITIPGPNQRLRLRNTDPA
jgi:hypothetical protein